MVSRRRFIESGVAGSLVGAFATWGSPVRAAREIHTSARTPLHAVIFDERFADAVRFGQQAARLGLPVRGLRGDVTDYWYAELHPLWKRQARPLAGLTAYAALFCLERLAWDHGMRVVYRGEHTPLAGGEADRIDWPAQIASLIALTEARSTWSGLPPLRRAAETRVLTAGEQPLHSWVIAPPARAVEVV